MAKKSTLRGISGGKGKKGDDHDSSSSSNNNNNNNHTDEDFKVLAAAQQQDSEQNNNKKKPPSSSSSSPRRRTRSSTRRPTFQKPTAAAARGGGLQQPSMNNNPQGGRSSSAESSSAESSSAASSSTTTRPYDPMEEELWRNRQLAMMMSSTHSSSRGGGGGGGGGGGDSDAATANSERGGDGLNNQFHDSNDNNNNSHDHDHDDDDEEDDGNDHHHQNNNDNEDPQLQRLLDRLRREHSTNFGGGTVRGSGSGSGGGGGGGLNQTRARYLLEASAGNVGLASALYWEDYLAETEGNNNGGGGGGGGREGFMDRPPPAAAAAAAAAGGGGCRDANASSTSTAASSTAAVSAGRRSFGSPKDLPKYGKRSSPPKKRKGGGGDFDSDVEGGGGGGGGGPCRKKKRGVSFKRESSNNNNSNNAAAAASGAGGGLKSNHDQWANDAASARKPSSSSSAYGSGARKPNNRGSTLSSMHQFHQKLDEEITSLQERLSSYQSRLSNECGGGARNNPDRNAADDEASMLAAVDLARAAALRRPSRGGGGTAAAAGAAAASFSNNNNDGELSSAALAEYPNLWRMGLDGYGVGGGGEGALGSPSRLSRLFPHVYAAYGAGAGRGGMAAAAAAPAAAAGGAGSAAAAAAGGGMGSSPNSRDTQASFAAAMSAALRSAGSSSGSAAGAAAAAAALPLGQLNYPGAAASASAASSGSGAAAAAAAARPPFDDFLSRAFASARGSGGGDGRLDDAEQARALIAALAADPALSGATSAAAAGAGGNGGDDDSEDDNDDSNDHNSGDEAPRRDERREERGNNNNNANNRNNARDDDDDDDDDDDSADNAAAAEGGGAPLRRSMRIRSARSRAARNPPARNPPAARRRRRRRRDSSDEDEDDDEDLPAIENLPEPPAANPRRRVAAMAARAAAAAARANNNDSNASVDISDDDDVTFLPGPVPVFRLKKGKTGGESGKESLMYSSGKRRMSDHYGKPKFGQYDDSEDENDHSDDESVDIDLLLHSSDAFAEPSSALWRSYPRQDSDESGDDDNDNNGRVNIPISWLRSGFKLSKCGNGLAVAAPSDDEWERNRRTRSPVQRDGPLQDVRGLFPYNCKGVSALLSIVTALIYSGASIQGGMMVSCDANRIPFDELTLDQRKREFDPRLVDALASLIFVAAQAGSRRCGQKLVSYEKQWARRKKRGPVSLEEEGIYTSKRLALQRRMGVCHVCWWEEEANATIFPESRDDPNDVRFKTSFTSIHDLKSYVKTHLRSFKEPGGCALLLETILRCHGPCAPEVGLQYLLKCRCGESLKHIEKCAKNKKNTTMLMPEEHNCMSTELLSLLLTGEVHSTYEDWSADMFGIGLLRMGNMNSVPVNNRLIRPVKPIWICMGDLGFSTLFLNMKGFTGSTNSLDDPGKVFQLAHWNCWSGERTWFQVISSMHDEEPYRLGRQQSRTVVISDSEHESRTVTESISARLRLEHKRDAAMPCRDDGMVARASVDPDLQPITERELQSVSFHPEDEKYYPGQYRRWRFHFDFFQLNNSGWTPFYRLLRRQRLIVEMKLAPRICGIVRSRWPLATLSHFSEKLPQP